MRYKRDSFLIEGKKNTLDALQAGQEISSVYFTDQAAGQYLETIIELAEKNAINLVRIPESDLEEVSTLVNPEGVLGVGKIGKSDDWSGKLRGQALFLYRINDPGNLGTILRTAAWFGLENILLSSGSVDPYNPKVVRAAMGGLFYVNVFRNINFQQIQNINRYQLIAADMSGQSIQKREHLPNNFILCLGSESHGLPSEIMEATDLTLSIPKKGKGESLNLAVSAAIMIKDLMLSS